MNEKKSFFAHRGYYDNVTVPENSLPAFQKALDNNLNIELDIQILKDNTIIVFHDLNLKRMTGLNKKVKNCTLEEINSLYLINTKEKIPLLTEVLSLIQNKVLILIDIKNEPLLFKLEKQLLNIIKSYKNNVFISSFNPISVHYLKQKDKNLKCGLIIYNFFLIKKIINTTLDLFTKKLNFLSCNKEGIKYINFTHPLFIWTLKNKKEYLYYKNKAKFFIVNYEQYILSSYN